MKPNWIIASAGFALNLALGNLYAWSVFSKQLVEPLERGGFGWSKTAATLPYSTAIVCLAVTMVPAGRLQDKYGPRIVATVGSLLAATGLIVAGWSAPDRIYPAVLGFGLLTGAGIGLGYAAATPAAVKGFAVSQRGLVTGFVVSGFGLAPVYIAPLSDFLLRTYGFNISFRVLGLIVAVTATVCAQFLETRSVTLIARPERAGKILATGPSDDATWQQILSDPNFYSLYFQFAAGSIAGLTIIGHLAKIAALQSGNSIKLGFLLVALLAIFNAGGRVLAGLASDWIGRNRTIASVALIQAVNLLLFSRYTTLPSLMTGAAVAGCSYGACAALFASATADCWGTKNLGLNYGLVFTSWGVAGIVGPLAAGYIADVTGSYALAYKIAAGFLAVSATLALLRQAGIPLAPFAKTSSPKEAFHHGK